MANYEFWPATIAACVALWLVISYRLKVSVQPLRLEMADKGEAILASPIASETSRAYVRSLLDSAFSYRGHLLVGLFVVPVIAVAEVVGKSDWLHKSNPMNSDSEVSEEVRHALQEITNLHGRITYANNPLLTSLLFLQIGGWFMLSALLSALIRGVFPRNVSREYVVERIDYAYEMIPVRIRRQIV